jgi:hypothetical protein
MQNKIEEPTGSKSESYVTHTAPETRTRPNDDDPKPSGFITQGEGEESTKSIKSDTGSA